MSIEVSMRYNICVFFLDLHPKKCSGMYYSDTNTTRHLMIQTKLKFGGWRLIDHYNKGITDAHDAYIRYLMEDYVKQKNARKEQESQGKGQEPV